MLRLYRALGINIREQTNTVGSCSWLVLREGVYMDVEVIVYPQPEMTKSLFSHPGERRCSSKLSLYRVEQSPSTNLLWQRPFLELWALSHKLKITAEAESRRETERYSDVRRPNRKRRQQVISLENDMRGQK